MPDSPTERPIKRRRGARVVVVAGDTVLLQCDTDPGLPGSRFWQAPGGGVDEGESPREAAARELREETGLRIDPAALLGPVATRIVNHGYSDRILIQAETFYLLQTQRFKPVNAALTEAEARRRVASEWFPIDDLPPDVWPSELPDLVSWVGGEPLDLGEVEESTVPVSADWLLGAGTAQEEA